jgi:NADP-dependent 3-hydroxy acid dehydrogenase YdfG
VDEVVEVHGRFAVAGEDKAGSVDKPPAVAKGGSPETAAALVAQRDAIAMPPDAVARAIGFAIEQPAGIDVGEVVVRPTAQA